MTHDTASAGAGDFCFICCVEKPGSSLTYHQYSPMWANSALLPFGYSDFLSLTWRLLTYEPLLAENSLECCLSDYFRTGTCHCFDNAFELLICVCLVVNLIYVTVPWKSSHIPEINDFIYLYCCKQINQTPCYKILKCKQNCSNSFKTIYIVI